MSRPLRTIIVHGHFYQPPREDPWFDEVEREPSAAPYHDWNQRVEHECYRAVVAARVLAPDGRISRIVNTLAWISFDVGATLCEWLEREARPTYEAMLEADRLSRRRCGGHGNAMAMPYHHVILPLASRRDKVTEVRWGIADFRRRFGRDPVGMWLPETAVDDETLEVLAAEGIRFTVLGPHQVEGAPADGSPGLYRTGGGRRIAIFAYDGPISHDVAFGGLLQDAAAWEARLLADHGGPPRTLVTMATDGETYGHHHAFGEMALAALLVRLEGRSDVRVENFASFLERHPAAKPVTIVAPSSWSCPHGVERWRSDCSCKAAPERPTQQRWRRPLREALDWLARELHTRYEQEGWELLGDPWTARDAYGTVVGAGADAVGRFAREALERRGAWTEARAIRVRELLEMERDALRMFTSCGWFFDDIGGIEAAQVLKYAARAIALAGPGAEALEASFAQRLAEAPSNDPRYGSGREVYWARAHPPVAPAARAAAGYAAARAVTPEIEGGSRCYPGRAEGDEVVVTHCRTGRAHRFRVTVLDPEGPGLVALVQAVGREGEIRVPLAQLPEQVASLIRGTLRRRLARRWLGPEELEALGSGELGLREAASRALKRAVASLAEGEVDAIGAQVVGLADLLELLEEALPFDAQTAFFRIREGADPKRAQALAPLGRRLGFA